MLTGAGDDTGRPETATRVLHRLTSYEPGREWTEPVADPRVLQDLTVNDLSRLPWPCKGYPPGLTRLALPRELPATSSPAVAVLAGTARDGRAAVSLAHLSRLLYWSAGVVRTAEVPYGRHLFRAAGSAGARFPLELYVAVPDGGALPSGVHWYDPVEHALVRVGPAPLATGPGASAPAIVVTGVPWRTGWRYRERGYRHVYWDAGTMLAQLLALADSAGVTAGLYTRFPDAAVAALVGADGVHEFPVAVVALGDAAGAIPAAPALSAGGPPVVGEVDAAPVEFPLVTAAQRAGECERLGEPWQRGAAVHVPLTASAPVEAIIAARGSQRRMDATRGLSPDLMRTCMDVSLRGIAVPHWVVVHDVDGLAPGVYRWPGPREPVRGGALRDELCRVCLDQALARDAAFVVIAATDLAGIDDHEYREAQLAAGLAEGRLHLAAYALGASASGMTFLDSEVPGLLGEPCDGLLFTCVGVPAYKSATAGGPGTPSPVRMVSPS